MFVIASAALIALAALGALLCAVHFGWLAKMQSGFLVTLILAVAGSATGSAFLVGVWAQVTSQRVLFQQAESSLASVGDVAEAGFHDVVTLAFGDLNQVASTLTAQLPDGKPEKLARYLDMVRRTNDRFLGMDIIDAHGKILASSSGERATGGPRPKDAEADSHLPGRRPLSSVGLEHVLEGKEFVSKTYFSFFFKKRVLDLATPVRDDKDVVIAALRCQYDLQGDFEDLFHSVRFQRTGYAALVSSDGRIVAHPDANRLDANVSSYVAVQRGLRGETGWVVARNESGLERLFLYRPLKSPATIDPKFWVLLIEIDMNEVMQAISKARRQFLPGTAVLAILGVLSAYFIALSIKRPIQSVNEFAQKVQAGQLSDRIVIHGKDEIGRLGTALNEMAGGLQERDRLNAERISSQKVLQLAAAIQMGFLPKTFPAFPDALEVDIFATEKPALEVGGDLYDFFRLDDNRICFLIGDVSDKGIPAALFMAMVLTAFRITATDHSDSIARILGRLNRFLFQHNESQMFVTLFACILDLRTGAIEYGDGGHEPPFIVRHGGGVEMLKKEGGVALGFMPDYEFRSGTIQLDPGDTLLLYTDGVNEAMNASRQMFKVSGIEETLRSFSNGVPAETVAGTMIRNVEEFAGGAPQSDDITVLVVRYCGRNGSAGPVRWTA
jgi:serine phosphatase RsbU (regulator of sigma subunit)